MAKKKYKSESTEQIQFVAEARVLYPGLMIFAIPNGGFRNPREAAKLRNEGVTPGVPDLIVPHVAFKPNESLPTPGLWIEMKKARGAGGDLSKEQIEIHKQLRRQGYDVATCYGKGEALSALKSYMQHVLDAKKRC